jgi:peptidoglycan-associated lipoprotein
MNAKSMLKVMTVMLCLVLVLGMTGCKHKKPAPLNTEGANKVEKTSGEGQPEVDLSKLLFEKGSKYGLQTVMFDFDSSALRPDAMATLKDNAEKIKAVPGVIVQVAGHCDERGTQEYNLALGERRALAVRNYLIQLGVSGDRLVTISYGKEFPAVQGNNEAAWAQNRRAEFNAATK